jgi:hypothetical protein
MPIIIPPRQINAAGDNANTGSNTRCQPAFLGTSLRKPITHGLVADWCRLRGAYAQLPALLQADLDLWHGSAGTGRRLLAIADEVIDVCVWH